MPIEPIPAPASPDNLDGIAAAPAAAPVGPAGPAGPTGPSGVSAEELLQQYIDGVVSEQDLQFLSQQGDTAATQVLQAIADNQATPAAPVAAPVAPAGGDTAIEALI